MSTNNAFLQADIVTTDLASESTLKQIETELVSGTLEVDFPASALLNVAIDENDISGNLPIRIDANDVSGNLPISISELVLTDVDFTTTQTDDLSINVNAINTSAVDSGNGIAGPGSQRVCIASDNQAIEVKTGVSAFNVGANITSLAGTAIDIGAGGTALGTQRVVLVNDAVVDISGNVNINGVPDMNIQEWGGATLNAANPLPVQDVFIDKGAGATGGNTQRVVVANDNIVDVDVNIIRDVSINGGVASQSTPLLVQFEPSIPFGGNPVLRNDIASLNLTTISTDTGNANTGCARIVIANDDPNLSETIPNSNILKRNSNILDYYFKGWSIDIPANFKTLGTPSTFNEISLLSANTSLQISSDNAGDTGISILVSGYDSSFSAVSEVIITNGQTAVNLVNQYFRINNMRIVSENNNVGVIYLSIQGSALTGGVPNNQANYIYSMLASDRVGWILNACIPPTDSGFLYPMNVAYSLANATNDFIEIHFQMKKTNSNFWYTEFNFYLDENANSQYQWDLRGIGGILNNDTGTPSGYDLRIQTLRNTAGACNVSCALSVKQK